MSAMNGKSEADEPRSRRADTLRTVRYVVWPYRWQLALVTVASFVGGLAEAAFLLIVTATAFAITEDSDAVELSSLVDVSPGQALLVAVALVFLRVGLATFAAWRSSLISTQAVATLRNRLLEAYLHTSWPIQQSLATGRLQELAGGHAGQAALLSSNTGRTCIAIANLVAMLGLATATDPRSAAVMLIAVLVLAALLRPLRTGIRRHATARASANRALATATSEVAAVGMELRVFDGQTEAARHLDLRIQDAYEASRRASFIGGMASTAYAGLAYVALIAALFLLNASSGGDLATLGGVLLVMLRSLTYGQALQGAVLQVLAAAPFTDRLGEAIEHFESGRPRERTEELTVADTPLLEAESVSFSYGDGHNVLHDISFRIEPNETIGIIGPSGGGKTTLVQLLLGLREPDSGTVRIANTSVATLNQSSLARHVAFVPQSPSLVGGTIAENIRFFRPSVDDAAIERAARLAHLHPDVSELPNGYQSGVGPKGGNLSGGQRQRLCIARALATDPDVLILDEPTSALDAHSEEMIRETLDGIGDSKTVIVIAHRMSTLSSCDRIMVIQDGRIQAFDTIDRLEADNAFFQDAIRLSGIQ